MTFANLKATARTRGVTPDNPSPFEVVVAWDGDQFVTYGADLDGAVLAAFVQFQKRVEDANGPQGT